MTEPATETFKARVSPEWLAILDAWRRLQPDLPSRAEAVRRLVATGLEVSDLLHRVAFRRDGTTLTIADVASAFPPHVETDGRTTIVNLPVSKVPAP
jgi:hypothetical protein